MTCVQKRSCECSQEDASASAMDSRPAPSFKFSVSSEEGINLFVDLNSSSVDWYKRLENDIGVCQCLEENKFQSFREELLYLGNNCKQMKDPFFWNTNSNSGTKDDDASFYSSPNTFNREADNSLLNHPDAKNGPLEIFAMEACSFAQEESEHLKQGEHPVSISSNSGVKDMNSSRRPEDMESMDPDFFHVHQGKTASCSLNRLVADGPEITLNNKKMKLYDEIYMNAKMRKGCNPEKVVPFSVPSVISLTESKLSQVGGFENDTACSSAVNDPLLSLIDAVHSMETGRVELANSVESDHYAHLNILSLEEQASGSLVNRTEASTKLVKEGEKFISDGGRKRKRYSSQSDRVSAQFSGRVLRSAVRPRRSKRLVSKDVTSV